MLERQFRHVLRESLRVKLFSHPGSKGFQEVDGLITRISGKLKILAQDEQNEIIGRDAQTTCFPIDTVDNFAWESINTPIQVAHSGSAFIKDHPSYRYQHGMSSR